VVALFDGVLIDDDEVISSGVFEVDDLREAVANRSILPVLDRNTIGQVAVEGMVVLDERGGGGDGEFADGLINGAPREGGVDPAERVADPPEEERLVVVGALLARFAGGDLRPGEDGVAEAGEPRKGSLFDFRFGECIGGHSFKPLNMKMYSLPDFCFARYPNFSR